MKWPEMMSRNEMPKNYQEAFKNLANKLIFTEPTDMLINKENIKAISQKIQDESIDLDDNLQTERRRATNRLIGIKTEVPKFSMLEGIINKSEKDFLEDISATTIALNVIDDGVQYHTWGFTPKLAKNAGEKDINRNCFGMTTFIGALCNKRGIKIDMGITPDHPYVIAYLEDGSYIADGQNKLKKLTGNFEEHGNYKIYRPTKEDKLLTKMIMIEDFDQALIYETFENIEILRQISLGKKDITLPGSYEEGMKIADENKELLQKIDWRDMQKKLFPEIHKSFIENKKDWEEEIKRMGDKRKQYFAENTFFEMSEDAKKFVLLREDLKDKWKDINLVFKKHKEEIIEFLFKNIDFKKTTPDEVKLYFYYIKSQVEKKGNNEVIPKDVYNVIENLLFDKSSKK
ncbi:MAG: hypothetical protein V4504_01210 [Patescibacteria group bacterium]